MQGQSDPFSGGRALYAIESRGQNAIKIGPFFFSELRKIPKLGVQPSRPDRKKKGGPDQRRARPSKERLAIP